jgi:hypothetical protein
MFPFSPTLDKNKLECLSMERLPLQIEPFEVLHTGKLPANSKISTKLKKTCQRKRSSLFFCNDEGKKHFINIKRLVDLYFGMNSIDR